MNTVQLRPGLRVKFLNGIDEDIQEGIINGEPYVVAYRNSFFHVECRVPVYVSDGDRCIDVAGENITEVEGVEIRRRRLSVA